MSASFDSNPRKPLLTVPELHVRFCGAYGLNSLYAAIRTGRLKSVRVGRKILVPASEVEDFIRREVASHE